MIFIFFNYILSTKNIKNEISKKISNSDFIHNQNRSSRFKKSQLAENIDSDSQISSNENESNYQNNIERLLNKIEIMDKNFASTSNHKEKRNPESSSTSRGSDVCGFSSKKSGYEYNVSALKNNNSQDSEKNSNQIRKTDHDYFLEELLDHMKKTKNCINCQLMSNVINISEDLQGHINESVKKIEKIIKIYEEINEETQLYSKNTENIIDNLKKQAFYASCIPSLIFFGGKKTQDINQTQYCQKHKYIFKMKNKIQLLLKKYTGKNIENEEDKILLLHKIKNDEEIPSTSTHSTTCFVSKHSSLV